MHTIPPKKNAHMDKNMNLKLNPSFRVKLATHTSTCTLFTPGPAKYNCNVEQQINKSTPSMNTHAKILDGTFDPKLTYNTHIQTGHVVRGGGGGGGVPKLFVCTLRGELVKIFFFLDLLWQVGRGTKKVNIGGLMIATNTTCLGEISVTQHKLFNSVPY